MPRITLIDISATGYKIDTLDWDKIRAWLAEWVPRLHGPDPLPDGTPLLRMEIMPLFDFDWERRKLGDADWNADTRFFGLFEVPWDVDGIMIRIDQQREMIEQAKAEERKFL